MVTIDRQLIEQLRHYCEELALLLPFVGVLCCNLQSFKNLIRDEARFTYV